MNRRYAGALWCALWLACLPALADAPDAEVNPLTGMIETVESYTDNGQTDIRHVLDPGQGAPSVITKLTNGAVADLGPRIAIHADGTSGVAWWRDTGTDAVYARTYAYGDADWSTTYLVSDEDEGSRDPVIISDGSTMWIAFVVDLPGGDTGIGTNGIMDDPNPMQPRVIVGSTDFTGNLDVVLHYTSGHLWVSWDDGSDLAGWSEYDYDDESWSLADYESYSTDTLDDARDRIGSEILGN